MDSETTGYDMPDNYYEQMNSFDVKFCPNCRAMNYIKIDWCGSIRGLTFCVKCGKEII